MFKRVNSLDQKGLADIRDLGKSAFRDAGLKFLGQFRNFHCDRTNQDYGDFTKWDDRCSLNVDSLTGWSILAWGLTVGYKPTANPGEWGIAQNVIYNHLTKINVDRRCFFSLTAHIEKEMDEMTGVKKITVSTVGAKLAPKIPPFFSEVIRTSAWPDDKGVPHYEWSTLDREMDLKSRALPRQSKLKADFGPIIEAYHKRVKLAGGASYRSDTGVSSPPVNPASV